MEREIIKMYFYGNGMAVEGYGFFDYK